VNILAGQEVVPELLQHDCTAKNVFNCIVAILDGPEAARQKNTFAKVIKSISADDPNAAAREILKIMV
jgi:lipid-A-disaccharide synthase